jgi:hypothetical protein
MGILESRSTQAEPVRPLLTSVAKIIIEKRFPGSTTADKGVMLLSNANWLPLRPKETSEIVKIPEYLASRETLTFLEIDEEVADTIWEDYNRIQTDPQAPAPFDKSLIGLVSAKVTSLDAEDAYSHCDDWRTVWKNLGMSSNFIDRMMNHDSREWRYAESAKKLAHEHLEARWAFLQSLDMMIKVSFQYSALYCNKREADKLVQRRRQWSPRQV